MLGPFPIISGRRQCADIYGSFFLLNPHFLSLLLLVPWKAHIPPFGCESLLFWIDLLAEFDFSYIGLSLHRGPFPLRHSRSGKSLRRIIHRFFFFPTDSVVNRDIDLGPKSFGGAMAPRRGLSHRPFAPSLYQKERARPQSFVPPQVVVDFLRRWSQRAAPTESDQAPFVRGFPITQTDFLPVLASFLPFTGRPNVPDLVKYDSSSSPPI